MRPISASAAKASIRFKYDLPKAITDKETRDALVEKIKAGDESALLDFIKGHMRFAISIAARYAIMFPTKVDDLVSIALYWLVIYSQRIAREGFENRNVVAYLDINISHRIKDALDNDNFIKIVRQGFKAHQDYVAFKERLEQDITVDVADRKSTKDDTDEILKIVAYSAMDYYFIENKKIGLTDSEIAKKMGISRMTVHKIKVRLKARYAELKKS